MARDSLPMRSISVSRRRVGRFTCLCFFVLVCVIPHVSLAMPTTPATALASTLPSMTSSTSTHGPLPVAPSVYEVPVAEEHIGTETTDVSAVGVAATMHTLYGAFGDALANRSSRAAVLLADGTTPARTVSCLYSLTFRSDAGRYFAVAPETPYTEQFRIAVANDVQRLLTGHADGDGTNEVRGSRGRAGPVTTAAAITHSHLSRSLSTSTESNSVLSLFLHSDGTCVTGRSADIPITVPGAMTTAPESAKALVRGVEKQAFGHLSWVGAELEVVFVFPNPPMRAENGTADEDVPARAVDSHSNDAKEDDAATTGDPSFTDLLPLVDAVHAFSELTDNFYKCELTRRDGNSRLTAAFLYPGSTLGDLAKAAAASAAADQTRTGSTSSAYPRALTEHLEATYGSEEPRCAGVSCVFAIIAIVLVLGLFGVALVTFFVRRYRRRHQESSDNKRLMQLEAQFQRTAQ